LAWNQGSAAGAPPPILSGKVPKIAVFADGEGVFAETEILRTVGYGRVGQISRDFLRF
jgi:hypothetical protein